MSSPSHFAIIGAGPAALIAAERLAMAGHAVDIYDRMPSPARKLLIAGRGGLNLTHSEPLPRFLSRYGDAQEWLTPALMAFPPDALCAWCAALGIETFVGSSGRIFPRDMKAVALLRAWLQRLAALGVRYHPRHHWLGWRGGALYFSTPLGEVVPPKPTATLLALGGASWPRLGSDGGWVDLLRRQGVEVRTLVPANCGFNVAWSEHVRSRFAGAPLKPLAITHQGVTRQGEAILTASGIEGGPVYALSAALRDAIAQAGSTTITLDFRPGMPVEQLRQKLSMRGNKSLGSFLRGMHFSPVAVALLYESGFNPTQDDLAARLKSLPLTLTGTAGLARAISSAGGITRRAVNAEFMLHTLPGVFVAGEMLDWEAPTGGYLLQACFSTGMAAAEGMLAYA